MSEERQLPDYDPELTPDPIATGIAIGRASPAIDSEVIAFLRDQRQHLHEQFRHLREQLRLRLWEQRMGVFLRVATAIVGVAVASGFALMVWDAAHSRGLIIEPFSVPPEMAERGLSGQVVAAQLLDRLSILGASESSRATQSYANNWGDNIKVEIPETGVSIGELQRFLRGWLGHDIHISGEVYRNPTGIAVTARAGGKGATFTGAETDLDALVQKAAEHVFETTQPYRYANFLDRNYNPVGLDDRFARATAIYHRLIAGEDSVERAWALNGLGTIAAYHGDLQLSAAYYRKSIAATPDFTIGYFALGSRDIALNREEAALADFQTAARLLHRPSVPDINPGYLENARAFADADIALLTGDNEATFRFARAGAELPNSFSVLSRGNFHGIAARSLARRHDKAGMQRYMREVGYRASPFTLTQFYGALEDWQAIVPLDAAMRRLISQSKGDDFVGASGAYDQERPSLALAFANLGQLKAAQAVIAPSLADCSPCLRTRAWIAELGGQHARADYWFARAIHEGPSSPFAYTDWGKVLLARGRPDEAIAQFKIANQKGPHFADPLEGWGEALMAKNQSHLALKKFAEAEKYAPNWGRLHLKWGEALSFAGKPAEARAQFARAATLNLTPSEKSELNRNT